MKLLGASLAGEYPAAFTKNSNSMKKIIIVCALFAFAADAVSAQSRMRKSAPVRTTMNTKTTTVTNGATPDQGTTIPAEQRRDVTAPTEMQLQSGNKTVPVSSDIIVPDHAYEPKGTENVGFFGNGTGGSTIGSTNTTNGGTVTSPVDNNRVAPDSKGPKKTTR